MICSRLITGGLECNNYLLVGEATGQAVLIDCGDDAEKIKAAVKVSGATLSAILLTHGHADHIAAVDAVATHFQCPVYIHGDDRILLKRALYNLSVQVLGKSLTIACDAQSVYDQDRLDIAGFEVKVIHTPGHTNGSVCYRIEDCLFTGDTLFKGSVGGDFPPFGDLDKEIQSIRRQLFTIEEDLICYPGHGEPTTLGEEKHNNIYCRI